MTFRVVVLAIVLAIGAGTLPGRAGAGINDIISDFLYYQEELKVKARRGRSPTSSPASGSGTWR